MNNAVKTLVNAGYTNRGDIEEFEVDNYLLCAKRKQSLLPTSARECIYQAMCKIGCDNRIKDVSLETKTCPDCNSSLDWQKYYEQ